MANRNVYDMDKQKVALVLSMGGARGIAHIGVIEELLRHNFEITSIAGSSMGAMVGAKSAPAVSTASVRRRKDSISVIILIYDL